MRCARVPPRRPHPPARGRTLRTVAAVLDASRACHARLHPSSAGGMA